MRLTIESKLEYKLEPGITTILLQIEAASLPDQAIEEVKTDTSELIGLSRVPAEDMIGERSWIRAEGQMSLTYRAVIDIDRPDPDLTKLPAAPLHELPGDVVKYLLPSRYCVPTRFAHILSNEFGGLAGGALIVAVRDWIEGNIAYVRGSSNENTMAADTYLARQGICRDYAHLVINFARAADIPARFVSVYAPSVEPPDFHAVAQVYLDGAWHLVDATGMASPSEMAIIGVGRDAVDVAFMNIYGASEMVEQTVSVERG
jgi:transglutaminase-like putative cysteine protease